MPEIQLKNQVGDASSYDVNVVLLNSTEGTAKYISEHLITSQKQADWAITDQSDPGYIHNKPTIPEVGDLLPEIVPEEDDNKVLAVIDGQWAKAEMPDPKPQVQTDWNAIQEEGAEINLAVIKNKPTDLVNEQYVQGKIKEIPQPNWEEFDETSKAFIQNKPFSRPVGLIPDDTYTAIKDSEQGHYVINLSNLNFTVEQNVEYVVIFNGVSYELLCIGHDGVYGQLKQTEVGIGNASLVWLFSNQFIPNTVLDLPFFIQDNYVYTKTSGEFQIYLCKKSDIKHLNKVFIPDELRVNPDWTQTEKEHLGYILNRPSD